MLPVRRLSVTMSIQVWRKSSSNWAESGDPHLKTSVNTPRAFLFFPGGFEIKGVGWIILLGVEPHLDSHERRWDLSCFPPQLDHTPPPSPLPSFILYGHRSLPLTCSLGLSCYLPARLFVLFFYPLISLAGHWFSFAIPSLSLGGASVVAEENRYPFYVFIISQIKKLMN